MADGQSPTPYEGPIKLGYVFDWEKGKKHLYERYTVMKMDGTHIWAWGRSGETYFEEPEFRRAAVFVSDQPLVKPRAVPPAGPIKRYEGPIDLRMVFDYEPGKKHLYERLTILRREGTEIWATGRGGGSYHEEDDFRNHVVPVAPDQL
jgi:hypothetical protein